MNVAVEGKATVNWIGILFSVVLFAITVDIGFTAWLSTRWIETETTQDRVLATLEAHQLGIDNLNREHTQLHSILSNVDDSDRWYKSLEIEYQKRVDDNFSYLQLQIDELKKCFQGKHK